MKNIFLLSILLTIFVVNINAQEVNNNPLCNTVGPVIGIDTIIKITPPPPFVQPPSPDSDGDGLPDSFEGTGDLDRDGIPNYLDLDSDGDGVGDDVDQCYFEVGVPPSGCHGTVTDRHVFWVHGYKGTEHSWALPPQTDGHLWQNLGVGGYVHDTYFANSNYPDYSDDQNSRAAAAANLKGDIKLVIDNNLNAPNNFLIAHSGGGIVSREMGVFNNAANVKAFDGFITFGTPHQGAGAADTYINSPWKIENAAKKACESLTAGPFNEALNGIFPIVGNIVSLFTDWGGAANEGTCNLLGGAVLPLFKAFGEEGIEAELTSSSVSTLAPMATSHNAAFYGIETDEDTNNDLYDESLTPRFIGSLMYAPNTFPLWGAGASDELGIRDVHDAVMFWENKRSYWREEWEDCWLFCSDEYNTYLGYKKGVDWWKNLNNTWKDVLSALTVEINQVGCECTTYQYGNPIYVNNYYGENDCSQYENNSYSDWTECYPIFNTNITYKPSDGFILSESAMNAPGANYPPRELPGSSHFQMRNDENTRDAMYMIFDEGLNKTFFHTSRR